VGGLLLASQNRNDAVSSKGAFLLVGLGVALILLGLAVGIGITAVLRQSYAP